MPLNLLVPATSEESYTVDWSVPGGTVDYYELEESVGANENWGKVNLSPLSTSASFTNKPEGDYSYCIRACNNTELCSDFTDRVNTSVVPAAVDIIDAGIMVNNVAAHVPEIGTLPGSASVSGGAAAYTIPITVPPGRRGMQPAMALTYSSRSGNGVMGMGWSLSGLSSIHRCPRTIAQNGSTLGVQMDNTDKLCLNGQRLCLSRHLHVHVHWRLIRVVFFDCGRLSL